VKLLLWILIFVVAIAMWLAVRSRQSRLGTQKADPKIYFGLRDMMLHGTREKFGIPAPPGPTEPWGVLMDWGIPAGSATVVAMEDGNASIYLSSGGGFLGGGQSHDSIRNAAKQTVDAARGVQPLMHPTNEYPLPANGEVTFYVLTDSGVFTARASEDDLRHHRSPYYKLGDAAQNIITEYRQIQ
jgi:hypothetical protein